MTFLSLINFFSTCFHFHFLFRFRHIPRFTLFRFRRIPVPPFRHSVFGVLSIPIISWFFEFYGEISKCIISERANLGVCSVDAQHTFFIFLHHHLKNSTRKIKTTKIWPAFPKPNSIIDIALFIQYISR